jgi:hypothetical protein
MSRRQPTSETQTSTDIRSDISFMNRQKKLRSLYRDFRTAIDSIRELSPPEDPDAGASEEEEQSSAGDVDALLSEIELMQAETEEIIALISKPKFAKYPRVQSIKRQLQHLQSVNANLRSRAEALLDVE